MTRRPKSPRPALWAEGRQHPLPEPRTFLRAALRLARQSMAGVTARCASSAAGFGAQVTAGRWRVPPARLGRTGRYLPPHRKVGTAVLWGAALLDCAARTILPPPEVAGPPPLPLRPVQSAAAVPPRRVTPRRPQAPAEPDLAALRALIAEEAQEGPAVPAPDLSAVRPPTAPDPAPPAPRRLLTGAGWLLGHGLLLMALPWGAVRATLAHLDGRDLREV